MMKKIVLMICITFQYIQVIHAQSTDDSLQRQAYLFEDFIDGAVLSKSGEVNKAPLNYSSFDQSILFQKDGKIFTLTDLTAIDTIYINERKFLPLNNVVYEIIHTTGKIQLYVTYSSKMRPWTATTDYKGSSKENNNQVNNTVSDVYVGRSFKGNYSVEIIKHYWLKDYKNIFKANNLKDFLKVFKESTNPAIADYAKQNHIDFRNEADLVRFVDFCNLQ